jgi:polyhydroxyalkanoate synthase
MPRTLIDEGELREVYHYRPAGGAPADGDPVLLVTPLAAPSLCFDLRRGCSLVEHLVAQGRPTYLVEYGEVSFRNRTLGMEHWVDEVVPAAIRETSAHCGGRPVHVVGWSLGGIFALLTAADQPDLPIASVAALGTPFDVKQVPLVAPLRPLLNLTDGRGAITRAYQLLGGAPKPVVRWAYQLSSFQKLVTKPLAVAMNLDDTEYLAQLEAVDRFTDRMIAYPGRTFGQLYHRFVKGNALVHGSFRLGDRTIALDRLSVPVLVFAGATDGIAPVGSVRAVLPLLSGSRDVRFEIVPGGHLGMLTGRGARTTTWRALDEWLDEWTSAAPAPAPRRRRTTKKAAAKKSAAKKPAAEKAAPRKGSAKKGSAKKGSAKPAPSTQPAPPTEADPPIVEPASTAPHPLPEPAADSTAPTPLEPSTETDPDAIGVNPARRYGSANSRALAP